ncbi:hypothetical protein B0H21DRAFT_699788 [Amylocystis lapponica]|nr:hypothetical protein B0H21DRAFT_699788 [Amylocystis lapponica]
MTNWSDDVIEEEMDEGEEVRSDGDVLGEVTGRVRRRAVGIDQAIPYEEQWETDMDAFEARKANPPLSQFRQCAQMHSDWVNDILLCNHNQMLVSASSDGTVRAWAPHEQGHTGAVPEPTTVGLHADYVRCLAYCREQQWIASGSFDRTVKLWDLGAAGSSRSAPAPLITLFPPDASGPKASMYALATDPYGHVVAAGSPERVIRMWDPRAGKRVGKLVGHTDNIRAILLSEDAKYLLTGSADASIKLWSLSSQRCLHTFTHHTDSVWSLFSSHPSLEIFYSGDRSGLVCKVDVEGCADVSEGECIVLCQDTGERENRTGSTEGINKIVAMDDNLLWTATGSSSIKRWKVPSRRAVRGTALAAAGKEGVFISPSPFRRGTRAPSLSPSVSAAPDVSVDPEREGEDSWYGIPFESLVRLTSPNEAFGGPGPLVRAHDPEIATLYSAASIMSMPRITRAPLASVFHGPGHTHAQRSTSPFRSETLHSYSRTGEETQTLHPGARLRAEFEEREVAADAVPLCDTPDEVVQGEHGLVRCALLNDRVHALTVDTAGEVAVWDVLRGACLGRFLSEDVAAASVCGSETSGSIVGSVADKDKCSDIERSPREALETVRERIEGEAVVAAWSSIDTKTGVLTVHLNEKCFEAEIYADEAGYMPDRRYGDETRLNVGKWVLRNLFAGFVREQQRAAARRMRDSMSHDPAQYRLQRGSAPSHIELNGHPSEYRRRTSSDSSRQSLTVVTGPKSASIITSPTMLPAVSPSISAAPRSSPLMTPLIPINPSVRDSTLSPIPQSPNDTTPMPLPRAPHRAQTADTITASSGQSTDYFSLRRRGSVSNTVGTSTPDDYPPWAKDAAGLQVPTTPSGGGLMGRLRAFGKNPKRHPNELGVASPGGALAGGENAATSGSTVKTPQQALLSGPLSPPSTNEAPPLPIYPNTSLTISEEAQSGWTTLYRGHVSSTGADARTLEEVMPMWLLEYLLLNKVPPVPVHKISFVLLPFPNKDPNGEQLPELLNTTQSKLTASRFLRVRKLTSHVQDKLDKLAGSHAPTSPNTPRSSLDTRSLSSARSRDETRPRAEDLYEILCNDVVLPLDMTLAAVRQYVWRQSVELSMYYRRRTPHLHH